MVGTDDQDGVRTGQLGRSPRDPVHTLVRLQHLTGVTGRLPRVVERMARIHEAPEQMADPVGERVDLDIEVDRPVGEQALHHLLVLVHRGVQVVQEVLLVPHAGRKRPGVLRPSDRPVEAELPQELGGETRRIGEGNRVAVRMKVERREP